MPSIQDAVKKVYGHYPEKVLQFGEGNFLRGFVDWMIDMLNREGLFNGSIVLCQPIKDGMAPVINAQDGLYTLVLRGKEKGQPRETIETISSVSRCINPYEDYEALLRIAESPDLEVIVSNTTEAGIAYHAGDRLKDRPPVSFPAKMTAFLHHRYSFFNGSPDSGLLVLPVELIDDNGGALKSVIQQYAGEWNLGEGFMNWCDNHVHITSTLVDRIVTGHPKEEMERFRKELGYDDKLLVAGELFNLWVIEGDSAWADILPVHRTAADVIWTPDVAPYKMRKVRILNGGHTSTSLAAYLAGHDIVLDFMQDPVFREYLRRLLFDEIIPTLDLPKEELEAFANAVIDRFDNPYIKHRLLDISLNSCAKFCARSLPSLLEYLKRTGSVPPLLSFSLAAFLAFYKGSMEDGVYTGCRADGTTYPIKDDQAVIEFFERAWKEYDAAGVARAVLSNAAFWNGKDLTQVPGLLEAVSDHLERIELSGDIRAYIKAVMASL